MRVRGALVLGVTVVLVIFWLILERYRGMEPPVKQSGRVQVIASFFPYAEFARGVSGDLADVVSLVPAGVEPHDFEPTPQDIERLYRADVVIINGVGIDAWAEKVTPDLLKRGVRVIVMSEVLQSAGMLEDGKVSDPHFWLDPVLAEREVAAITEELSVLDSSHAAQYRERARAFSEELHALDQEYRDGLRYCALRTVVASHDAFTYLAKRYTLEVIPIAGLSPDAEPSPKRLSEIADTIRTRGIHFIFFETLVSPKLSETLARETGTQTLVFDPIEGGSVSEDGKPTTYLSIMRANLGNLRTAMECQ